MAEKEGYFVESRIRGYSHRKFRTAPSRRRRIMDQATRYLKQAGTAHPLDIILLAILLGLLVYVLQGYLPPILPVKVIVDF